MDLGDAAMKMNITGIDDIVRQMAKMQQLTGETAKAMLTAGGNEMQREMINTIVRLNHVESGDMKKSVSATKPNEKDGALGVEIYPQGMGKPPKKAKDKGRTGVRNSVKMFVLEHGRSGRAKINATGVFTKAVEKGAPQAFEAMSNVWDEFMQSGEVPQVKKLRKGQK